MELYLVQIEKVQKFAETKEFIWSVSQVQTELNWGPVKMEKDGGAPLFI